MNGQEVDCGNSVRFPGNVTGASTSTSVVTSPVPGGFASLTGAQNSSVLLTSSSALAAGSPAAAAGGAVISRVSGVMIVLGAAVSAFVVFA